MTRETRNNLIFLVVLIVLIAPGGIILFKKKSQPGARPIGAADVVINTTAWMDPYASPNLERLAPAATLAWLDATTLTDGFARLARPTSATVPAVLAYRKSSTVGSEIPFKEVALGNAKALVTSEAGWFQAVATRGDGAGQLVRLVLWADEPIAAITVDGQPLSPSSFAPRTVEVPVEVRHNLQNVGFIDPPTRVIQLDIPCPAAARQLTLTLGRRGQHADTLTLP